jgi:hypothetical protein
MHKSQVLRTKNRVLRTVKRSENRKVIAVWQCITKEGTQVAEGREQAKVRELWKEEND